MSGAAVSMRPARRLARVCSTIGCGGFALPGTRCCDACAGFAEFISTAARPMVCRVCGEPSGAARCAACDRGVAEILRGFRRGGRRLLPWALAIAILGGLAAFGFLAGQLVLGGSL